MNNQIQKQTINVKLYTPYDKQLQIHNVLKAFNVFGVVVVCGRQVGKSLLGKNQAIKWCLELKNQTVLYVLPTDSQVQKVYTELKDALPKEILKASKGQSGSQEITFINNSKILLRSALQGDSLRGYTVQYLIIDEAAFIEEATVNSVLLPTLSAKGKKVLILSTPKGKNWLYKYYNKPLKDKKWKSFTFTSYDSPHINKEFIDEQKNILPDELFKQEYMGEFIDKASIFKNLDDICVLQYPYNNPNQKDNIDVYCGVDLGMISDYTVATIINNNNEVLDFIRFTNVSTTKLKSNLIEFFNKWKPQNIVIEQNGLGIPIVSDLLEDPTWSDIITPFVTGNNKSELVLNLVKLFNNKNIKLPNEPQVKLEFENFIMYQTKTGTIKYAGISGVNDDIVMSVAFAYEALSRGNKKKFDYVFGSL
jgi:phage FluMu gp28-like protein